MWFFGKELLTDTLDTPHILHSPSVTPDITLRLQMIISTWKGAQNGLALATLHQECVNAVGSGSRLLPHLLPAQVLFVAQLDAANVQRSLKRQRGVGHTTELEFRVPPSGRFDAALVPSGGKDSYDRYLLVLDEALSVRDQVVLYGHAVGHLLLNYQEEQLGKRPFLAPQNGYSHADTLAELRLLETARQDIDRRVLDTFELLKKLLDIPEESRATFDVATADLRLQLAQSGWSGRFLEILYRFTDGRVYTSSPRRGERLSVDALLRASESLPIAIVHALRAGESHEHAVRLLHTYAQRMALPFAYLLEENGDIQEFDWSTSSSAHDPVVTQRSTFPTRENLLDRWTTALRLTSQKERSILTYPYYLVGKKPRYYQEAAINQTVIAVLQALRGLRPPRLLLTLATGTGKTMVAFQILWKLKRTRAVRNVLFLTDRDFLVSQAMDNEFAPFGDARYRIEGSPSTAYDINFAIYQSIIGPDHNRYLDYPSDFFQVIVIDECHRGSAQETSEWRKVLKHFSQSVQIGLTATPLSTDAVQTDEYFGESLYKYSLRMGINDGFLAPYRVRRVLIGPDDEPLLDVPAPEQSEQTRSEEPATHTTQNEDELTLVDIPATMETSGTMLRYTKPIAQHLAAFLQRTDPYAKTIVFCVDQAHAEDMRLALQEACASWIPHTQTYVVRVVSDEKAEGKRALGNFTTPDEKFPVIVTTSKLLSTGVDVPTCQNIVLARPIGSLVEFKQIIGRGTRLFTPQKRWFTILDYAGTIKHFFDPDFDGDPEAVEKEVLAPESVIEMETPVEQNGSPLFEEQIQARGGEQEPPGEQGEQQETVPKATVDTASSQTSSSVSSPTLTANASAGVSLEEPDYQCEIACTSMSTPSPTFPPSVAHEQRGVLESQESREGQEEQQLEQQPGDDIPLSALSGNNNASSAADAGGTDSSPAPEMPVVVKRLRSGRILRVIGEVVYELETDGSTLRRGTYRECAIETTASLVPTPADLRARWLRDEQRDEIINRLEDEGVDLTELAYQQHLTELDPLDLLLHVVFHEPIITRHQRVERLRREHTAFFARFEKNLLARAVLDVILEKYVRGEVPDVSDVDLLGLLSFADKHTSLELAQPFVDKATGANVRTVLKELQRLLYSV